MCASYEHMFAGNVYTPKPKKKLRKEFHWSVFENHIFANQDMHAGVGHFSISNKTART